MPAAPSRPRYPEPDPFDLDDIDPTTGGTTGGSAHVSTTGGSTTGEPTEPSRRYPPDPAHRSDPTHRSDPAHGPDPARRPALWLPVALIAVAVVAVSAVKVVPMLTGSSAPNTPPAAASPTTPVPTGGVPTDTAPAGTVPTDELPSDLVSPTDLASPPESPAPVPTAVGIIAIDPAVADDSRVSAVAAVFDTYFTGVNEHDAGTALSVFDPAGSVDPNSGKEVTSFGRAIATTRDSQMTLHRIGDDTTGRGVLQAELTFRSQQARGYGPKPNLNETCTDWDAVYVLTQPHGTAYRILSAKVTHHSC